MIDIVDNELFIMVQHCHNPADGMYRPTEAIQRADSLQSEDAKGPYVNYPQWLLVMITNGGLVLVDE